MDICIPVLWIRSDPKLFAGSESGKIHSGAGRSGFEINLKQKYFEKLIKFDRFSTKC